jgi:hypothetical protein
MNHSDNIQQKKSSNSPNSEWGKAGKVRAAANKASADAFASTLKPIMSELLTSKSRCKRLTPTGWHLTDLAQKLNEKGIRTRAGKLFRPTTVKRLLDRMPDIVEAAQAVRHARSDATFKYLLGIDAPTSAAEAKAAMNAMGIFKQNNSLGV